MGPIARIMPDGKRLHLRHGPSDLIILAEGQRERAYEAAIARFDSILAELVTELAELRAKVSPATARPKGMVAKRMHDAALPFAQYGFLTRMAAVAGAIADEVLTAMTCAADLRRAYVNNGGDISLHLTAGTSFTTAICDHNSVELGRVRITADDQVYGIATSGRHGRSLSMGIADSVTVLAQNAAQADVAATLIANAVNLPMHPKVMRRAANDVTDDSDLGDCPVVTGCGRLSVRECTDALRSGRVQAEHFRTQNLIHGAALFLQGNAALTSGQCIELLSHEVLHA